MLRIDTLNGLFLAGGAIACWINVSRLWKDWEIRGIDWRVNALYVLATACSTILFLTVHAWFSTITSTILFLGNFTWVILAAIIVHQGRSV